MNLSMVFLRGVTSLPPEREIVFSIHLVSGTKPIECLPLELSELKTQVEDLIAKQFINPSASPWGAPVLLSKEGWKYEVVS